MLQKFSYFTLTLQKLFSAPKDAMIAIISHDLTQLPSVSQIVCVCVSVCVQVFLADCIFRGTSIGWGGGSGKMERSKLSCDKRCRADCTKILFVAENFTQLWNTLYPAH